MRVVFFVTANQKEVRRVTVLHRSLHELHNSDGNCHYIVLIFIMHRIFYQIDCIFISVFFFLFVL